MPESPTTAVSARLATRDDLPALEANETQRTLGLSAIYLDEQDRGNYYVVVGLLDGKVVGRVILDCRDEPSVLTPEMKLLWVSPQARRQGIGAVMTQELERLALNMGFEEILLGVSPDSPAAIPMYVNLGYAPTGDHRSAINLSVIDTENQRQEEPTEAIFRKSLLAR